MPLQQQQHTECVTGNQSATTKNVERVGSLGPVTVPPVSSTLSRSCMVAFCSISPGMATGTPGGYGHSNSALTLPAAAARVTLQSASAWLCHFANGISIAAHLIQLQACSGDLQIMQQQPMTIQTKTMHSLLQKAQT